jgi:hypothetical protein
MSQIVNFKLFYELVNTILEQQDISPERDKTGVHGFPLSAFILRGIY